MGQIIEQALLIGMIEVIGIRLLGLLKYL